MIGGILLAAGRGSRFGGDKLLAPLPDGKAVIEQSAHNFFTALDIALCVVRPEDIELQALLTDGGYTWVAANNAGQGMSQSLVAGVEQMTDVDGWVIGLGDMPYVQPQTIQSIAQTLQQHCSSPSIVMPQLQDSGGKLKRGHPVGFSHHFRTELLALQGDSGARRVIVAHQDCVFALNTNDPGVVQDIDRPGDILNNSGVR